MTNFWFLWILSSFVFGYAIGLRRGTVRTIKLVNSAISEGRLVLLTSKKRRKV